MYIYMIHLRHLFLETLIFYPGYEIGSQKRINIDTINPI